jgi:hypothetical protein
MTLPPVTPDERARNAAQAERLGGDAPSVPHGYRIAVEILVSGSRDYVGRWVSIEVPAMSDGGMPGLIAHAFNNTIQRLSEQLVRARGDQV